MGDIQALTEINYGYVFISVVIFLIGLKALISLAEWFCTKFGLETKWMRRKREERELLKKTAESLEKLQNKHGEDTRQSIRHDEMIRDDLAKLSDTVLKIKDEVTLMRTQRDKDKLAEYKDKIGESYRFYCVRKYSDEEPVPYWNHMEREALKGLIAQYESHGGSNSFVHSKVEPEMQTWKVID